jgi:phytoene dehydrogenase-like protein
VAAARDYDAVVVGGGHNGLVAGFYLARAGLRTVVLERREIVGGCCVTEEFAPGYRASSGAYVLSMLREAVWRDMRLVERGVVVDPAGPSLNLFADGTRLELSDDLAASQAAVRALSAADAEALPRFEAELAELAQLVMPLIDTTAPDVRLRRLADLPGLLRLGGLAAREAGAEVRTGAEVESILVEGGRAVGVALADGAEVRAPLVLSNADPKRTFLRLVPDGALPAEFTAAVREYRSEGTSIKINLAVDRLPVASGMPTDGVQPYQRGIMEVNQPLAEMDRAQAEARAGLPGRDPHIELCVPTVHDPSLAPAGNHIVTIDVNSQPYSLADGSWDDLREEAADAAIEKLEGYFPGLRDSILHRQVLTPLDLERQLGITGGHALHGEMSFDQLFTLRPVRGWADYRTPVDGLYLCGAGTHPGGGVTGANGRNAAREALRDRRKSSKRFRSHLLKT